MCDYSLMALPNRLAVSGEELVTYRFGTGAIGFVSTFDCGKASQSKSKDLIERIFRWLNHPQSHYTAVCLPPGARLAVLSVPSRLSAVFGGTTPTHEVVFTQTSPGPGFRDAIRTPHGKEILLQQLQDGFQVRVLSLSSEEDTVPEMEEVFRS